MCEICSKFTIKTTERSHGRLSGVFIVSFEQISIFFGVFTVNLEHTNAGWVIPGSLNIKSLYN